MASQPPVIIKAADLNTCVSTDIQAHTQAHTHTGRARRDTPLNTVIRGQVLKG